MFRSVRSDIFAMLFTAWAMSLGPSLHAQDKETELQQLLVERRDTLSKLFSVLFERIWIGNGNMSRVLQVQRDLLQANLELCATPQERIVVLQKTRDNAANLAKRWETEFTGNVVEVEQAKATLLEIRIELLREELKLNPAKAKQP